MADRYWVGGTASWDGTAGSKWALTSGGAGGQAVPTTSDDVFFDAASGAVTCTVATVAANARSLNFTGFTGTFAGSTNSTVAGSVTFVAGMTTTYSGTMSITGTGTLTSAGKTLGGVTINASGQTVTLGDALTSSGALTVTAGTLTTNNFNVTATSLSSSNTNTRTINLGSSTVTLDQTAPIAFGTSTNLTFNTGTSTINLTSASAQSINTGALNAVFYNIVSTGTLSATTSFDGTGSITINNFSVSAPTPSAGVRSVTFAGSATINGTLSTTGTAGNRRVWFRGATYGLAQTLTINSAPSLTDADFRDIYVIGTAAPISGTRIGNLRGCRGITFSTPKTVYWNLAGAQNWSANGWATTSTGTPSTDNFPLAQDTATFTNAGSVTGTITMDAAVPYTGTVDMSGRTSAMTLGGSTGYAVYGNWVLGSGVTQSYSGTLTFSGRNTQTITSAGKTFSGGITVDSYGGTVELADALNIGSNSLTVTNGTFDTKNYNVTAGSLSSSNSNVRTITLGSSTVTLSSGETVIDFTTSTNLNFNCGTSSISFTGVGVFFSTGSMTFYDVSFSNAAINVNDPDSMAGSAVFRNLTIAAPSSAGIRSTSIPANQTITGTLTVAGATAVRRIFVRSNTLGTTRTLTVNSLSATDCDFRDITIAGTAAGSSPTRAGDCGGNTGITFPAAKTVYWNLAGSQNWSATAWAPGSGGTPDINNFPLAQDTAVFDNTGSVTGTITINAAWNIGTFDASLRTSAMTLTTSTNAPVVYGDWKFGTGVTSSSTTGTITFAGRGTENITSNGISFGCPITIDCATGTVQLADALTINSARTLTLTSGTFDAVTYNVTTGSITAASSARVILKMGSGTWTLSGTGLVWQIDTTPIFFKGTANIVLSDTSASARTFNGGGVSYNKLTIGGATGISTLTISGSNQFTELASTKTVAHTIALGSTTQTFGAWTVTGTVGNVVTFTGTAALTIAGAAVSGVDYLALGTTTVSATSPGEFYAGANSTATGVAAPLYLTAKPADSTRYWVGGTGNWSDTARWSTSSGGGSGASVPRSHDDVVFDSLSNATAYTATVNAVTGGIRTKALTIAGPLVGNVTLAGSTAIVGIHGNVTLPATGLTRTYTGAITLSGSSTGRTFTTNGVALASAITVNGVNCEWTLGSALNNGSSSVGVTNGNFLLSTYNLIASTVQSDNANSRTINFGSGTVTLSASTPLNLGTTETNRSALTVTAGTAQINCSTTSPTFSGNNQTFYNVSFTSTSAGTVTINGVNSFNNFSFTGITSAGLKNISITANQTITGTLTLSAGTNATMRHFLQSNTIGTTRTLTCAAVASLTDIDFRDITIAGAAAPVSGTRLGDCKGNSGITFDAAKTVYRVGAGANWSSSTSWSNTSGGTGDNIYFPLAQDTAIFDTNSATSGQTKNLDQSYNIGTIDMSARTSNTMTLATSTNTPTIYGNWINGTGTTLTGTGLMTFAGRGSQTITSAGRTFTQGFNVNTPSGSVTLQDAFICSSANTAFIAGTFDAAGYNVSLTSASSGVATSVSTTRTIAIGSGTWTIAGTSAWSASTSTNLTVTGTGTISLTSASAKTFAGGGISYSGITLDQGGAGALTISGNNTFANITNTYSATGATNITIGTTTQRVTQWTATGAATRVLTVQGTSASSPGTLILTGGTDPNVDYLTVTGVRAYSLVDTWYAGANSTNNGSLGWYFESGVVSITATISETSTATDAVSAVLIYISSLSETSTATDTVDAPGSTFNPSLSEAATATDAVAGTLTLLAQVADALTGTDTVSVTLTISPSVSETATATDEVSSKFLFASIILESATITDAVSPKYNANPSVAETATATDSDSATAVFTPSLSETATATDAPNTANNTFNPSLAETATGTDSPVANLSVTGAVSETATATDTTQSVVIFVGAVSETATATDLISALTDFLGQIAETATATDITLVAPSVFGPQVQEAVAALDLVSTFATFNVQLVESATVLDSVIGAYLWNVIDDSQSPDWGPVPASQSAGWVVVDDSQSTNWQNVDDSQTQNWAVVNDGNTVTWTQVTT
jgi:hypothetical protein